MTPDPDALALAPFVARDYHGGQFTAMYALASSGSYVRGLAREAEALLPAGLPRQEETIGPLLRALLTRSMLSRDMANLAVLLSEAQRANALPPGLHALFSALWGRFTAIDAEGISNLLKRLSQQYRVEARLARAIQTGQIG